MSGRIDVCVVAATGMECRLIVGALGAPRTLRVEKWELQVGVIGDSTVAVVTSGVGKVNAALPTAAVLAGWRPALVLGVGVGGAFPDSGLRIGDVAVATEERYGDEGAETAHGFLDLEELALPSPAVGEGGVGGRFPVPEDLVAALAESAPPGVNAVCGPFVTVSTVTGSAERAARLSARTGGICESMEGAAVAHAAAVFGVRFGEVRGISNLVGPRERGTWRLDRAAEVAQATVLGFLGAQQRAAGGHGRRLAKG